MRGFRGLKEQNLMCNYQRTSETHSGTLYKNN